MSEEKQVPVMEIGISQPEAVKEKKTSRKKITSVHEIPGVGENTANKLISAGYDSLEIIATSLPAELSEIGGIGDSTAVKVINIARDALEMGYENAGEILERRKTIGRITTGSTELDSLLGGGVETQAITECFGRFGSGKSQIAFQLCVNVQLPKEQGGLEGSALFVDTENTFRPERIIQMAKAKGLDPVEALKKIQVARAHNSDHQMLLINKADKIIKEQNVKVVIVDSLMSAFRSDYMGRGELAPRQQNLNKHLHALQRLADLNNLAIYLTNQVMDRPDILFGDPTTPVGGNIIAHQATYRVYLRRSKEDRRIAKLVDSPNLPDGECLFSVREDGVQDTD
ncbi:MAG: DNA repair and recombination protein RadA [Candidatus Micrarchaeia archaeon]